MPLALHDKYERPRDARAACAPLPRPLDIKTGRRERMHEGTCLSLTKALALVPLGRPRRERAGRRGAGPQG